MTNENVCLSGGSKGADRLFGELAAKAGHQVMHFSFLNHHCPCPKETIVVLSYKELLEADPKLNQANLILKRAFPSRSEYVNNLLRRNYYQIKTADRVYASTALDENMIPLGGTAWAIMMAFFQHEGMEIYNYDHSRSKWFIVNFDSVRPEFFCWKEVSTVPKPHGRYAGIGSSELPDNGRQAIEDLYK